jgi:hypothetical protein
MHQSEAVIDVPGPQTEELCSVCAHPQSGHDAIASRFCAATLSMAIARNCICKAASTK